MNTKSNITQTQTQLQVLYCLNNNFEYYLAVSSDTLVTMSKDLKPIEFLRRGTDDDGYLCGTNNLDDYLDGIFKITNSIDAKQNPLTYILN